MAQDTLKQLAERNAVGNTPTHDGQVTLYRSGLARNGSATHPPVIYVNGMNTPPSEHRMTALVISAVTKKPVWGVYNQIGGDGFMGFVKDVVQCGQDKMAWNVGGSLGRGINNWIFGRESTVLKELSHNKASESLYLLLKMPVMRQARIVAHSQGNLITSGAIKGLAYSEGGKAALKGLRVYGLASPTAFWPDGLSVKRYTFADDFVTWLSGGGSYFGNTQVMVSGQRTMGPFDHDVYNYIAMTDFWNDIIADLRNFG